MWDLTCNIFLSTLIRDHVSSIPQLLLKSNLCMWVYRIPRRTVSILLEWFCLCIRIKLSVHNQQGSAFPLNASQNATAGMAEEDTMEEWVVVGGGGVQTMRGGGGNGREMVEINGF